MSDLVLLTELNNLIDEVNKTKGTNAKVEVFKKYEKAKPLINLLWHPDPSYKTGITVNGMDKFIKEKSNKFKDKKSKRSLVELFMDLVNKKITGDDARSEVAILMQTYKDHGFSDLIKNLMSKSQNTRVGYKNIAKAFPDLWSDAVSSSLGESSLNTSGKQFKDLIELGFPTDYDETSIILHLDNLPGQWYFSLKLDGIHCRTIIIKDPISNTVCIEFKKRSGHPFTTLELLKEDIAKNIVKNLTDEQLKEGVMLAGEIRINTEGPEDDFTGTASAALKKTKQMDNFRYDVYDFIPLPLFWKGQGTDNNSDPNFITRYQLLSKAIPNNTSIIKVVPQELYSKNKLLLAIKKTKENNQEGLVIRRGDSMYQGKRHKEFIKYKNYWNEEYLVHDIVCENMDIKVDAKTGSSQSHYALKNIVFYLDKQKKDIVHVGTGFTPDQRIEICKYPENIVGSWVAIKHYGISQNKLGTNSLRMPVFLHIIGKKERDY